MDRVARTSRVLAKPSRVRELFFVRAGRLSLLLDKHAAVHYPFMDNVAPFIDEREALRAHFIGSDDIIAALGRAHQGQTDRGTE